jgi:hypothetical protein
MKTSTIILCASALFTAVLSTNLAAAPSPVSRISGPVVDAVPVEQAQYRGRGANRGYRGRSGGGGVAIGLGAAIIGGIILSEAARAEHRSNNGSAWERCAQTYRSFEQNTGMYTGYDGQRHTCPYLR